MAVKLCYHCSHEVNEEYEICPKCGANLKKDGAIIEVAGDLKGYSYVSTTNAYQDENLLNFSEDIMENTSEELISLDDVISKETQEDILGREHYELYKLVVNFINRCLHVLRYPKRYSACIVGMLGCIFIILGSFFCTYYCYENDLIKKSFLKRDSFFMILFAIAVSIMIIKKIQKYALLPIIFAFVLEVDLVKCLFNMKDFVKVGLGFVAWIVGTVFVFISVGFIGLQNRYVNSENEKETVIKQYDIIWILLTILIAGMLIKDVCNHNFDNIKNQEDMLQNKKVATSIELEKDKTVKISLVGACKKQYENKDVAVVVLDVEGNTNLNFEDEFSVEVYQNIRKLCANSLIDGSSLIERDMATRDNNLDKKGKLEFFVYYLDSSENIILNIKKRGEKNTKLVLNTTLKLTSDL